MMVKTKSTQLKTTYLPMRNIQCKSWVFFAIKGKFQAVINAIAKLDCSFFSY